MAARPGRAAVVVVHSTSVSAPATTVIIPVLNEAASIGETIAEIPAGWQVVVADGGSTDGTPGIAEQAGAVVITSDAGRATQMNAGAADATGDVLLFLHADTRLPDDVEQVIAKFYASDRVWGRFDMQLSGEHAAFRMIESMMNVRSILTGICTGDQALFMKRATFESLGGYADIPLMEDIEISRRLRRLSWPFCASASVRSSSRRWEQGGILRTVLLMWSLRLRYFLGASPDELVRRYYR